MSTTVAPEVEDKESLNRLALLIFMASETGAEGQVPDCLDVQDGQVLLSLSTTALTLLACKLAENFTWRSLTRLNGTWRAWCPTAVKLTLASVWLWMTSIVHRMHWQRLWTP